MILFYLWKSKNGDANQFRCTNPHKTANYIHYLHGLLNTSDGKLFTIKSCDKLIIANPSTIVSIKAMYFKINFNYPSVILKIKHGFLL